MATTRTSTTAAERLQRDLRETRAFLDGHFLLSSGRHGAAYVQCALLLQHPDRSEAACADLAALIREQTVAARPCEAVVGPALGAVTLAYELARALGALPYYRLLDLDIPNWAADECPLCRAGGPPPVKPGSRPNRS